MLFRVGRAGVVSGWLLILVGISGWMMVREADGLVRRWAGSCSVPLGLVGRPKP